MPSMPAVAEAAGHEHATAAAEHLADVLRRQRLGVDPLDMYLCVARGARVEQRLRDAQICVVQAGILADEGNLHGLVHAVDLLHQRAPLCHVRLARAETELAADDVGRAPPSRAAAAPHRAWTP